VKESAWRPQTVSPRTKLDARVPAGPIDKKWDTRKFEMKLVNPANKRKYRVIVVGSGWPGASAAASLASSATASIASAIRTVRAAPQHRGARRHQRRQELSERR
jgi:hypothetical protein